MTRRRGQAGTCPARSSSRVAVGLAGYALRAGGEGRALLESNPSAPPVATRDDRPRAWFGAGLLFFRGGPGHPGSPEAENSGGCGGLAPRQGVEVALFVRGTLMETHISLTKPVPTEQMCRSVDRFEACSCVLSALDVPSGGCGTSRHRASRRARGEAIGPSQPTPSGHPGRAGTTPPAPGSRSRSWPPVRSGLG